MICPFSRDLYATQKRKKTKVSINHLMGEGGVNQGQSIDG